MLLYTGSSCSAVFAALELVCSQERVSPAEFNAVAMETKQRGNVPGCRELQQAENGG